MKIRLTSHEHAFVLHYIEQRERRGLVFTVAGSVCLLEMIILAGSDQVAGNLGIPQTGRI